VADLPVALSRPDLSARLHSIVDIDGKLLRALEELGPLRGRDVVIVDDGSRARAAQIEALGARARSVRIGELGTLEEGTADVVVAPWAAFVAGDPAFDEEVAAAGRVARPEGRLLVVQDYGRDDVRDLIGLPPGMGPRARDRDDFFLDRGFKIRVLHCWWTFDSLEDARSFLAEAFGEAGVATGASLRRPRLAHNIGIYHRDLGASDRPAAVPAGARASSPSTVAKRAS
jgi:hypothetical protein